MAEAKKYAKQLHRELRGLERAGASEEVIEEKKRELLNLNRDLVELVSEESRDL